MKLDDKVMENLRSMLPRQFRRSEVGKLTGGLIKPQQLIALAHKTPQLAPVARKFGRFVVFDKEEFLQWVEMYYGRFAEKVFPGKSGGFGKTVCRSEDGAGSAGQGSQGSEGERGEPEGIFDF